MERILKQTLLYDFYGELLTEHQKEIYEDVVLNDFSLSEVAENCGISRQGVYDLVKRCNCALEGYEEKLRLVERFLSIRGQIQEIERSVKSDEEIDRECLSRKLEKILEQL